MRLNDLVLALGALVALVGCGSDGASGEIEPGFEELYAQGLTKYVGAFEPANDPEAADGLKT